MIKLGSFLVLYFAVLCSFSQEICNNGIDDDLDGLIDYNDVIDCSCNGFGSSQTVPSLIPNSSFENNSCCPTGYSQLGCADTWIQASEPTSDYWNTCGEAFAAAYGSPGPNPDGNGIAGFINWNGYKEYVGACLLAPMTVGNTYVLDFWLGFGTTAVPIDITFYGTTNCGDLPFGTGCPVGQGSWAQLASVTASGPGWQNLQVTFIPTVDINALVIGPPCAAGPGAISYYYLDGLTLAETGAFTSLTIDGTGGLCTNDYLLSAATDTSGGSWQWFEDDIAIVGETGPTLDISGGNYGAGNYSAIYTVGNKCDKADFTVAPEDYPMAGFVSDTVCEGAVTTFTDTSTITGGAIVTSWSWDFDGDNVEDDNVQNPTTVIIPPNSTSLTVTGDNGCVTAVIIPVVLDSVPVSNFNVNPDADFNGVADMGLGHICLGDDALFSSSSSIGSGVITNWDWTFGDPAMGTSQLENPTYNYATGGDFTVNLTVTSDNNCTDTYSQVVHVNQNPTAAFTPVDVCDEEDYIFTDESLANEGNINFWGWDFEDDGIIDANTQNASNLYPAGGTYDVSLFVVTDLGCNDTVRQQVTVLDLPIADFDFTYVCFGQATNYTDLSTTTHGVITTWSWDYTNDGVEDAVIQNPSEVFGFSGPDSTHLTITTSSNCSYDTLIEIFVNPLPNIDFSWLDVCDGEQMSFTDLSSLNYGDITSWHWDFGDLIQGNSSGDTVHNYAVSGVHDVTLTVTSDSGCVDNRVQQVEVWDVPTADFTFSDNCEQTQSMFINSSLANGSVISNNYWDYTTDGVLDYIGVNGSVLYPSPATYSVQLIVETLDGCLDTVGQDIVIHPRPVVAISGQNVCETFDVTFVDNSVISAGTITSWSWDFMNGNSSTVQTPTETFNSEGAYSVELNVTSDQGCTSTGTTLIEIYPTPTPHFIWADVCDGNSVGFTDFSTVSNQFTPNSVVNWDWSFGDVPAAIAAGQFTNYLYASSGVYTVTLDVESNNGCVNSIQQDVTVHPNPIVTFTSPNPMGCTEHCADFVNNTSITGGVINSYAWNLGNGLISTDQAPSQCYVNNSLVDEYYTIELVATSDMGCQSTLISPDFVTVYPSPVADFEPSKYETTLYQPEIEFTNTSLIGDSYVWDFGGLAISIEEHPMYAFPESDSGTYVICLETTTVNGCVHDTCKPIVVNGFSSIFVPNAFTPNGDGINDLFLPSLFGVAKRDFSFMIFDRWGVLIYETDDNTKAHWDGTYKGVMSPFDSYVWKINGIDKFSAEIIEMTGHVTLIK
jgi:gliding motility-associated-like protein